MNEKRIEQPAAPDMMYHGILTAEDDINARLEVGLYFKASGIAIPNGLNTRMACILVPCSDPQQRFWLDIQMHRVYVRHVDCAEDWRVCPRIREIGVSDSGFLATDCLKVFLELANEKGRSLGTKETYVNSASGIDWLTRSTARDMLKVARAVMEDEVLRSVWGTREWKIITKNEEPRTITVETTVENAELEKNYHVLGGKTGYLKSKKLKRTHNNLMMVCEKNGTYVAGVVMNAQTKEARFAAMLELMQCAFGDGPSKRVTSAPCAYAENLRTGEVLYPPEGEDGGADQYWQVASMIKPLSILTVLDQIKDLNTVCTVSESDIRKGSGAVFEEGDKVRVIDLIYAAMLPSSNTAATALAHYVGAKVLCELYHTAAHYSREKEGANI